MRKTPKTNGEANLPIEPKNPDANAFHAMRLVC